MNIRKTETRDIDAVLKIYKEARETIKRLGIDQWQQGYPAREVLEDDIYKSRSYVVEENGVVCGTFAIIDDGEITYDKIYGGHWLTGNENKNYLAVHRVAISISHRGGGVSGEIVKFWAYTAKKKNMMSVRIDTHEGNIAMRRMLEKNGFCLCGIIHLIGGDDDGKSRVAYELKI